MTFLGPISSGRIGQFQMNQRLTTQLQQDQLALLRVQNQVSTGRRLEIPSDDAPAALRAISLQRLLEQKDQHQANLQTNVSYISATDASLNSVSSLLADVRGSALSAMGTSITQEQRQAVAQEVERAIQQLVDVGNQTFRGRHLFAGSRTGALPYEMIGGDVRYSGNERHLRSYSDTDVLFETNLHGVEVFGGISESAQGTEDLQPHLTPDTLLASLHAGKGIIRNGAIAVSDGTNTSVVDISGAVTVRDVARLIEAAPPEGRTVRVEISGTGLSLSLDDAGGGNLTVTEVAGGTTAKELGIFEAQGALTGPLVGSALKPAVLPTTPLANLLGTKASALVQFAGANNDLHVQAAQNGADFNDVAIQFVDDNLLQASAGLSAGDEYAEYDTSARAARASLSLTGTGNDLILTASNPGSDFNNVQIELIDAGDVKNSPTVSYLDNGVERRLTIGIDDNDETTVADVIAAIDAEGTFTATFDPSAGEAFNPAASVLTSDAGLRTGDTGHSGGEANTLYVFVDADASTAENVAAAINQEGTFTAEIDGRDALSQVHSGSGTIDPAAIFVTAGGSGTNLDTQSGLQIENGGQSFTVDLADVETVEDLLNAINGAGASVLAEINESHTGINIRSRLSGSDFSIGENGGQTATQLGVRTFIAETRLDDLNRGIGVPAIDGTDFVVVSNDGTELEIDVSAAETVGDVIDLINSHPLNNTGTTSVTARLAEFGNGIELVDDNPNGTDALTVRKQGFSQAAEFLGLLEEGESERIASAASAPAGVADLTGPNTDLTLTAAQAGTQFSGATVVIDNSGAVVGDSANVTYDPLSNTLTIDVDPTATRAITVRDAIVTEGTFLAEFNTEQGPNDGSGIVVDTGAVATLGDGQPEVLTGRDVHPLETESVFNTLIRLQRALEDGNQERIREAVDTIDADILRVNFARAENGARHQSLEVLQTRIEDETVELRRALSSEIDTDLTEAISELTTRQIAMQASLRTAATLLQLTILDFV